MNIFLVDDHPMMVEIYKKVLLKNDFTKHRPAFTTAYTVEEAYSAVLTAVNTQTSFGLAIIDQSFPGNDKLAIDSGSDLVLFIRSEMPDCKIIMITGHTKILVIYEIFKKIKPDGFVIKNDISPNNLQQIVTEVLAGECYQSPMVKNCMEQIWKKELMVDDYNRQILLYLSKGYKVKELEGILPLSRSPILRRISQMKEYFSVEDDSGLLKEAINQGFL